MESFMQWIYPHQGPFLIGLQQFRLLFPILFPPPLPGPESSHPYPPSEELPVTNNGPSQGLATPTLPYPRLQWGTWKLGLASSQRMPCMPAHRAVLIPPRIVKGQTVLGLHRVHSVPKLHCVGPCWGPEACTGRPHLHKQT